MNVMSVGSYNSQKNTGSNGVTFSASFDKISKNIMEKMADAADFRRIADFESMKDGVKVFVRGQEIYEKPDYYNITVPPNYTPKLGDSYLRVSLLQKDANDTVELYDKSASKQVKMLLDYLENIPAIKKIMEERADELKKARLPKVKPIERSKELYEQMQRDQDYSIELLSRLSKNQLITVA